MDPPPAFDKLLPIGALEEEVQPFYFGLCVSNWTARMSSASLTFGEIVSTSTNTFLPVAPRLAILENDGYRRLCARQCPGIHDLETGVFRDHPSCHLGFGRHLGLYSTRDLGSIVVSSGPSLSAVIKPHRRRLSIACGRLSLRCLLQVEKCRSFRR